MDTDRRGTGEKPRPHRSESGEFPLVRLPLQAQRRGQPVPPGATARHLALPLRRPWPRRGDPLIAWLGRSCRFRLRWRRITGRPWRSIPGSRSSERRAKKPAKAGPEGMVWGRPEGLPEAITRGRGSERERARERGSERGQGLEPVRAREPPPQRRAWRSDSGNPAWRQRPGRN